MKKKYYYIIRKRFCTIPIAANKANNRMPNDDRTPSDDCFIYGSPFHKMFYINLLINIFDSDTVLMDRRNSEDSNFSAGQLCTQRT